MSNSPLLFFFIHGAGGTVSKWRKVKEQFPGSSHVFASLPGHDGDAAPLPSTIEEYASVLSQQITSDVIVVGHSMGGLIGIELAAMNDHVKGLVLVNSHYELPVHPKMIEKFENGIFPDQFFYASYGKAASEQLLVEEKEEVYANPMSVTCNDFKCCAQYKSGAAVLKEIDVPFLTVYSTEDKLIPKDSEEKVKQVRPDVKVETISNAGHYSILEQPAPFIRTIQEFKESIEFRHTPVSKR